MRKSHRFSSSESSSLDPTGFEPQEKEDNLLADVEQFNSNVERFRNQLMEIIEEDNASEKQGQRGNFPNLRIHSSFSPLSKSIRALWRRHPRLFKTSQILETSSRLVTTLKDANCGQFNPNTVLEALEQLENAFAIALRNALLQEWSNQQAKFKEAKDNEEIDENILDDDVEEEEEEEKCSVKSAKANSSSGVSSSPNGPIKIVRRHSAFQLPSQRLFGLNKFVSPSSRPQHVSICFSSTQLQQLPKGKIDCPITKIDKKLLQKKTSTESLANNNNNNNNNKGNNNQQNQCSMLVELLEQRNDGMELAFERCKCWSKFATQLLNYARNRLALDLEYGQRQQKLAEQQLGALATSTWTENTQMMPLASIFGHLIEANQKFAKRAESTVQELQQRFVASLESRQKEHDAKRRKMKVEYAKSRKQMDACLEELRRARQTHTIKGEQYLRARDITLRQERECHQMLPSAMKLPNGQMLISNEQLFQKRRREVEKRRRAEGEALNRKSDAELEVCRLESELKQRRTNLAELRCRTVAELADLIRQCELTTIACTSTLLKGIASLWGPVPSEMERLADSARSSQPAKEFLTFLQQQSMRGTMAEQQSSQCPTSASSIVEGQTSIPTGRPTTLLNPSRAAGESGTLALASITSSLPSPSRAIQRRNALTAAEEHLLMAGAQQHQQKRCGKTSVGRLFDYSQISPSTSNSGVEERSEAAKSHRLQRTRQVTKCAQCEHLLLFDALKCQCCALVWHKKCLPQVQLWCGPSAATQSLLISGADKRRTSIFGVPLRGHLEAQQRQVPLIIERCVDELQRRGLGCKGLYRTCGVKSKVEEICAQFEQNPPNSRVDLASVHPMNIASVVKLYLRRLPEPLLTFNLYPDWLRVDEQLQINNREKSNIEKVLAELVKQLPEHNFHTIRFLMLHLNRVTWYEQQNLMTASNLAAVIAPSLIWQRLPSMSAPNSAPLFQSPQFINDAHRQTRAIELLIEYAFEVFDVDRVKDRRQFFLDYPGLTPPPADPEKMIVGEGMGQQQADTAQLDDELVGDEDDEEEEEELLEEEMELLVATTVEPMKLRTQSLGIGGGGCDSGIGSNSRANSEAAVAQKKEGMESSSSDLDCGSSAASTFRRLSQQHNNKLHIYPPNSNNSTRPPLLPTGPSSTLISNNSANRRPETAPFTRRLNGKQRSYTTSILVSPLANRRNMPSPPPPSQREQEGTSKRPMLTQRSLEETTTIEKPRIMECTLLRSGEVTIQLGQDCSSAAEREVGDQQRGGRRHSQSKYPSTATLGPYPSTDAEEDVSYV